MQNMHGKKNIKSECDFTEIQDNKLSYKCKRINQKVFTYIWFLQCWLFW